MKTLVSTPIFYVNSTPHLGHLYSGVLADVVKRYRQLMGMNIVLLSGTDEHGLKVQQSAANSNVLDFCTLNSLKFKSLFQKSNIQFDDFIRTTESRHKLKVISVWRQLKNNGLIYMGKHSGWYSVNDESFISDSKLRDFETLGESFISRAKQANKPINFQDKKMIWVEEDNYMFRLSQFQSEIQEWIKTVPIRPKIYNDYVENLLKYPLKDISISRPKARVSWGISCPDDSNHTIYVWLDALVNYLTVNESNMNHLAIIGKDILKFHAIYYPAFLLGLGLPLPKILCHGHWLIGRKKMSKSDNSGVDPLELIDKFGLDTVRYFLIHDGHAEKDSEYSLDTILKRKKELSGQFGNLLLRATSKSMNPSQSIPNSSLNTEQKMIAQRVDTLAAQVQEHVEEHEYWKIAELLMETIQSLNQYWGHVKPWEFKEQQEKDAVIFLTLDTLRVCSILLLPIMPEMCCRLLDAIGVEKSDRSFKHARIGHWKGKVQSLKLIS